MSHSLLLLYLSGVLHELDQGLMTKPFGFVLGRPAPSVRLLHQLLAACLDEHLGLHSAPRCQLTSNGSLGTCAWYAVQDHHQFAAQDA